MNEKAYKKILDELKEGGESAIDKLLQNDLLESFYIDFKQVATNVSDKKLHDSDKKNYVKALSGFSNTSGGLLIWGVNEKDKKFVKVPFENPVKFATHLNEIVQSVTQPSLTGVDSFVINSGDGKGFVVTEIPKYYLSPVQVIANVSECNSKYYIRSGSSFAPANHDIITGLYGRHRGSELLYLWGAGGYEENDQILSYNFKLVLQNKGVGILRDVWINFSSSGFDLELYQTPQAQSGIFTAWNAFGQAINLVTVDNFKCAPQQFINPFTIRILIKKNALPEKAWLYLSFGADQVAPVEKRIDITRSDLASFISGSSKKTEDFINFLGLGIGS